ncbi:hypothetical protein ACOBQX_01785 [Actinokineospora sp. G85]|uniref:hypothetical protein n=1 Tax=Actinokineospora sp. G85 TaxID=3406626 RepID=UPI003C790944
MPHVQQHRRRLPGSWFRTTTVQSHYRRSPTLIPTAIAIIATATALILLLIILL